MIMFVDFKATDSIIPRKTEGVELSKNILLEAILVRSKVVRFDRCFRDLPAPRMGPNHWDRKTTRRLGREQPSNKILHAVADEPRRPVVGC